MATTSGTTAIFLALAAAGVGQGDEVIVPDVTFIATANAVRLTGATPVLVDIDPRTLNVDPEQVRQSITPRTKAIVPVHVSGRSADMPAILAVARAHGLAVIEDAAEALLSKAHGRWLGTIGTAGCLSFSPNKTITTGQGGMVLTDDAAFAARLRALKDQGRPVRGTGGNDEHPTLGFNFKLTNLQSAVGLAQAEMLEARVARLKQIYRQYRDGLQGIAGVTLPGFDVDGGESPQWVDAVVERRDALVEHLLARGIHCRPFWYPLHTQQPYRRPDSQFPHSSRLMPQSLWLPIGAVADRRGCGHRLPDDPGFLRHDLTRTPPHVEAEIAPMTNPIQPPVLSIVMPVRNEGINLRIMLKILRAVVDATHEVLVVYDREGDDSLPVVEAMMPIYPTLRLILNTPRRRRVERTVGRDRGSARQVRADLRGRRSGPGAGDRRHARADGRGVRLRELHALRARRPPARRLVDRRRAVAGGQPVFLPTLGPAPHRRHDRHQDVPPGAVRNPRPPGAPDRLGRDVRDGDQGAAGRPRRSGKCRSCRSIGCMAASRRSCWARGCRSTCGGSCGG